MTGTHRADTAARMVGQVAACSYGWTDPSRREGDEAAECLALQEWDYAHARPVLTAAQDGSPPGALGLQRPRLSLGQDRELQQTPTLQDDCFRIDRPVDVAVGRSHIESPGRAECRH